MGGNVGKEIKLAVSLQKLCDDHGKETDPVQSAKILHQFGLLYMEKSPDKISLIQSAAFLNAAVIRQPRNERFQDDLINLCNHVLELAGAVEKEYNFKLLSNRLWLMIKQMRIHTQQSLENIKIIPSGLTDEGLRSLEKIQIEQIRKLQDHITEKYTELMFKISSVCIEIMGPPPCQYSVTGLGSLARKEVTPFSDFEHIIVLEEGVQHLDNYQEILEFFRWFSVIFHIIIINLKESIVRSVAVRWLNDDSICGGDWFYDNYTPCGIKFDGMQLPACKFPLGRTRETDNKPFTIELIKPVSLMVKYLEVEENIKNGYHLADILTKSCFVAGFQNVHNTFTEEVTKAGSGEHAVTTKQLAEQLKLDFKDFYIYSWAHVLRMAFNCNIKRIIYRSTTLFMSAIGRIHSIEKYSCFEIIDALLEKEVISKETAHKLLYVTSVSCLTRLKVYMLKKGQDDFVGRKNYSMNDSVTLNELKTFIGEQSLIDFIIITHTFQMAVASDDSHNLKNLRPKIYQKLSILSYFNRFDRVANEWECYLKSGKPESKQDEYKAMQIVASAFAKQEKYIQCLALLDFLEKETVVDNDTKRNIMVTKSRCLRNLSRHSDAISYIRKVKNKLPTFEDLSSLTCALTYVQLCNCDGDCKRDLKQFSEAMEAYEESLKHLKGIPQDSGTVLSLFHSSTHKSIALCQLMSARNKNNGESNSKKTANILHNAMGSFQKSLDIIPGKEGETIEETTAFYDLMGCLHAKEKQYDEAKKYLEKSKEIKTLHASKRKQKNLGKLQRNIDIVLSVLNNITSKLEES